jgi:hypothetical protein
MKSTKGFTVVLTMVLLIMSFGYVMAGGYDAAVLRGIQTFYVSVTSLDPLIEQQGLTSQTLRNDFESKLRQAGAKTLALEEATAVNNPTALMLRVNIATDKAMSVFVFDVGIELWENCVPLRKPGHIRQLVSWMSNAYLGWGRDDFSIIRQKANDRMDEFINTWLSVNQK